MTILVIEGFDSASSVADLFSGILSFANASAQSSFGISNATQFSGQCLTVTTSPNNSSASAANAGIYFSTSSATIIMGTSILLAATANAGYDIGFAHDMTGQIFCRFILDHVTVFRGSPTGTYTQIGSGVTGLPSSGWAFVEVKATIGTAGAVIINVNGNQVLNLASVNTSADSSTTADNIVLGAYDGTGNGFTASFDNIYVLDTLGSAPNNLFLGPVRVFTRVPTANASVQFTPSDSNTNFQEVDELNLDGNASYNASTIVPSIDTFSAFAVPTTTSEVFAVQVKAAVRKDDAGNRIMTTTLVSSGSSATGNFISVSPAYQYISDIYVVDPHTNTTWNTSGVNASTFGYVLVS
jgi:hypothetical protein